MSDVKAVRYLLAHNVALNAVVPAANIITGVLPQGETLPAIAVTHISTLRKQFIAATSTQHCASRVQVTVHALDYPTQKSILALVRAALPRTRGTVNGVTVESLVHELDGPDFRDDEIGAFMGSVDYIITHTE